MRRLLCFSVVCTLGCGSTMHMNSVPGSSDAELVVVAHNQKAAVRAVHDLCALIGPAVFEASRPSGADWLVRARCVHQGALMQAQG